MKKLHYVRITYVITNSDCYITSDIADMLLAFNKAVLNKVKE